MGLVREYVNFERGKEPKRSMGIGKFYEIWRSEYNEQPIIQIAADLSKINDEARWEIYLFYKKDSDSFQYSGEIPEKDTLYFNEENRLGNIGTLKPDKYFPDPEESIHYSDPKMFDREIIDTLTDKGDAGARYLIEEYIKEWWEDKRRLDGILKVWFGSGGWKVDRVEVKSLV